MGVAKTENVNFYDPDYALQIKIGVRNLDSVFTQDAVMEAEQVIEEASDTLLSDSFDLLEGLQKSYIALSRAPSERRSLMPRIIDHAFRIKAETSLANCTLISEMAKSLQLLCEKIEREGLTPKNFLILDWHVAGLSTLFRKRVKGTGGEVGEEILQTIRQLPSYQEAMGIGLC